MSDGTGNERPIPTSVLTKNEGTTLALGTVLQDRYQIDRVVGLGGMGAVYRVRDLHFQGTIKWRALKEMIIKFDNFDQERRKLTFEREANLLADLKHPAIPEVYDFFYASNRAYLVLEYIDGKDLEAILAESEGFLDERLVGDWAIQLCDVLHYLHSYEPMPIVFRDLKPSNVMLTSSNRIMLIDFGIAKILQPGLRGTMIGTEGYSPPEQYRGEAGPVGDIYALGAMLHQLLTHSDPRMETPFTFHERPPRALNPDVSPEMEEVVMKCLAYESELRWQSALELKAALERALHRSTGTGRKTGVLNRNFVPPYAPPPAFGPPSTNGWGPSPQADAQGAATSASSRSDVFQTAAGPRYPGTGGLAPDASAAQRPAGTMPPGQKPGQAHPGSPPTPATRSGTGASHQRANVTSPAPLWTFEAEEEVRSSPAMAHNTIFIGSYDHNLYALDAQTGDLKWRFAARAGICGTPACVGDLVIIGAEDQIVYALDSQQNGEVVWSYQTGSAVRSSPRVFHDQVIVGSDDFHVHAIDLRNGRGLWKFKAWGPVRSSAAHQQGLIFIGSEDNNLYALETASGGEKWKYSTQHAVTSSPALSDSLVFVGSLDGTIYALESKTGWVAWRQRTGRFITASPLVREGRVYLGSMDGYFYCWDAATGRPLWKFPAGAQINSSAAFYAGSVYFGCSDGAVYGLDARSGQLHWKFQTGSPVPSSPLVRDGILYIGSNDHFVYAVPCTP